MPVGLTQVRTAGKGDVIEGNHDKGTHEGIVMSSYDR